MIDINQVKNKNETDLSTGCHSFRERAKISAGSITSNFDQRIIVSNVIIIF